MISVIVPVYKVEPFLKRCLDSIVNQTYRDLEIILVDDGSPDSCGDICDEYAKSDSRIKVIHKENGGLSSARNAGIDIATGEYITFVDSDDWIDQEMYEKLHEIITQYDADIAEVGLRFYRPWKPERLFFGGNNTKSIQVFNNVQALEQLYFGPQLHAVIAINVYVKLYRADLFKEIRFMNGFIHEDVEFTPRILFAANKIVKYDYDYYNYNIHLGSDSISAMGPSLFKMKSGLEAKKRIYMFFKEHPLERISEYTLTAYAETIMSTYYEANKRKDKEAAEFKKPLPKQYNELYPSLNLKPIFSRKLLFRLFRISPKLFCFVKNFAKKTKLIK